MKSEAIQACDFKRKCGGKNRQFATFIDYMEAFLKEITSTSKNLLEFREMYEYKNRLQTLTAWPFKDNCKCTPENMAKAGFIHHPHAEEPDVAKCFFCLIELEGWESTHDPWLEHSKRSKDSCGFLSLSKNFDDLTVEEYYELEMERVRNFLCKTGRSIINTFEKEATLTRKRLVDHFMNKYQYTPETETSAVCNKRKLCASQQIEEKGLQLTVSYDDKHGQR